MSGETKRQNRIWSPGQPLRLDTANFVMRSLTPADLDARYQSWADDPELMEHFGAGDMSVERMTRFLKTFDNATRFHLGIFAREDGLLIGYYFVYIDVPRRVARTAVLIGDRAYWGKGVVLETRAMLLDFLFEGLKLARVWGRVDSRNIPAIYNYKAQGFQPEGLLRSHGIRPDGSRTDQVAFGLLRDEWRARRHRPAGPAFGYRPSEDA